MWMHDVHQQLVHEIRFELGVVASGAGARDIAGSIERLSAYFQGLGICHLLESADVDQFAENLTRSGHAREYLLRRSRTEGIEHRHLAISRSEAILDAIAVANMDGARTIANNSITEWNADWEYEDDFLYVRFIHDLVREIERPQKDRLDVILESLEAVLEGSHSWRLEICRSLLNHDSQGFDEAMDGFTDSLRELAIEERAELEAYSFASWPRTFISIEGLALLRLASVLGLRTSDEYPLCPSIALTKRNSSLRPDIFREMEREMSKR